MHTPSSLSSWRLTGSVVDAQAGEKAAITEGTTLTPSEDADGDGLQAELQQLSLQLQRADAVGGAAAAGEGGAVLSGELLEAVSELRRTLQDIEEANPGAPTSMALEQTLSAPGTPRPSSSELDALHTGLTPRASSVDDTSDISSDASVHS